MGSPNTIGGLGDLSPGSLSNRRRLFPPCEVECRGRLASRHQRRVRYHTNAHQHPLRSTPLKLLPKAARADKARPDSIKHRIGPDYGRSSLVSPVATKVQTPRSAPAHHHSNTSSIGRRSSPERRCRARRRDRRVRTRRCARAAEPSTFTSPRRGAATLRRSAIRVGLPQPLGPQHHQCW